MTELCHCGKPLHYSNPEIKFYVDSMVEKHGENVEVSCAGKTYMVPRHYIALHGIEGSKMDTYGFEVIDEPKEIS